MPNDIFVEVLGLPHGLGAAFLPRLLPARAQRACAGPIVREGLAMMAGLYWDLGEIKGKIAGLGRRGPGQ